MNRRVFAFMAFILTLLAFSTSGFAGNVCNQSNVNLSFVIANEWWCDGTGGPFNDPIYCETSQGWYSLARGECKAMGNFGFIYAQGDHSNTWSGSDSTFCIKAHSAFEFRDRERNGVHKTQSAACSNKGGIFAGFMRASNSTFTFTGGALPPSTLSMCNRSSTDQFFALAFYNQGGWKSKGWYKVTQNTCYAYNLGTYDGDVYVFAKGADGRVWGGNGAAFCVHSSQAFDIPNSDTNACQAPAYQRPVFGKTHVSAHSTQTVTFGN